MAGKGSITIIIFICGTLMILVEAMVSTLIYDGYNWGWLSTFGGFVDIFAIIFRFKSSKNSI